MSLPLPHSVTFSYHVERFSSFSANHKLWNSSPYGNGLFLHLQIKDQMKLDWGDSVCVWFGTYQDEGWGHPFKQFPALSFFLSLFILRKRERECTGGEGAERESKNPKQAPCCQHEA